MTSSKSFHLSSDLAQIAEPGIYRPYRTTFTYDFENFFHPFIAELIDQLNSTSVAGMLDPNFLARLQTPQSDYTLDTGLGTVGIAYSTTLMDPKSIDVTTGSPYAVYNWELLYHIPVSIAVHLSNNGRFSEAQKWFHLVFDPTTSDTTVKVPDRYWRSFVFRNQPATQNISTLLTILSTPDNQLSSADVAAKASVLAGYKAILNDPFQPHTVARTRPGAYQWYVVMKYLDNLIAWGDSLFLQDTIETINEASLCYVLAANLLGPQPQALPAIGTQSPRNYRQLKQAGLDRLGNALVDLEAQFPFDLLSTASSSGATDGSGALFGIGRSLYFCIPQNSTLLAYWDTVADRLFKIRNSENIAGVAQQLPLFDPPLDPGVLVKAAAAGLDIGSIVSGLNQPIGPVRAPVLIQKSIELASEVRSLGASLLSALEKGDSEQLAILRQTHEIQLQQLSQNVRFLQWRHAQETTAGLFKSRASALERYTYYLRLLGETPDPDTVPDLLPVDRRELTEDNFDDAHAALVTAYDLAVSTEAYPALALAGASSPSNQSGASGQGNLFLNTNEDAELNSHLPKARDLRLAQNVVNTVAGVLFPIPSAEAHLAFWGIGLHSNLFSGGVLANISKTAAEVLGITATWEQDQAGIASRTAGYQRRADEWRLQANLAAREIMTIGRQVLASLLAEQIAYHDYTTVKAQVQQVQDIQSFLQNKFTNVAFYGWMQSEIAGLYYQYYRLACDTARRAEATMKQELMRPELDSTQYIQFNYWDTGHQGLLSGETLFLDVKRLELAYQDNNKRELEITRHISLRQLDPFALLSLKITGSCTLNVPEWLFDRDTPGLYLRRIKNVALSVPAVVGPYTGLNCTLSLQSSSVRTSPLLQAGKYARDTANADPRFVDYFASTDLIVTSSGTNDSGLFETNLRDDHFLPFEGAGAISSWTLTLPPVPRAFDAMTISDVILHLRYTARSAGNPLAAQATKETTAMLDSAGTSGQFLIFCLRYDFPTEWAAFVNGTPNFSAVLAESYFPYAVQGAKHLTIDAMTLYAGVAGKTLSVVPTVDFTTLSKDLTTIGSSTLTLAPDPAVLVPQLTQQVFLLLQYHFGQSA